MVLAFAEATSHFEAALSAEEGNGTARAALADLWRRRLEEAEVRGDADDAAFAETLVTRHDDGRLASFLKGDGSLALRSDPPGAEVRLVTLEDRRGILVPGAERVLGRTPLGPVPLPRGSYLCLLRSPGLPEVRYPVHVTRNRAWSGVVRLRTAEEVGEGFVLVPGGPFVYGEGRDARVLDLPDFAIARYPVTFGEYGGFLAALEAAGGRTAAEERLPRTTSEGPVMERGDDGTWRQVPGGISGPHAARYERDFGSDFRARMPVMAVSWDDARAYCEWRTRCTGREHRLPTEEEREKAARGVDGRRFPWGDLEDASLAKCRDSRREATQPEPVGTFPAAASVYGAGDMAGNIWDWTDSWLDARRVSRVVRGGGWYDTPSALRCTVRYGNEPFDRNPNRGFRVARSLP
jgi:serine/threonine-protein kinase